MELFRDRNLKQFSFNISTLLLIQNNHQHTWSLEKEKNFQIFSGNPIKICSFQSWNIMQNGLKLYFTQNYKACQCQIIVLKCFFATWERRGSAYQYTMIIPKMERCTKTKAAGVKAPITQGKFCVCPACAGICFSCCRSGLCFLSGFRSGFLLFSENCYHSSNKYWRMPVCQGVRH